MDYAGILKSARQTDGGDDEKMAPDDYTEMTDTKRRTGADTEDPERKKHSTESRAHDPAHHMTEEERALMESYESLDYDVVRNEVYRKEVLGASESERRWNNTRSWTTFALIGILTGFFGFVIDSLVDVISEAKYDATIETVGDPGDLSYGSGYAVILFISLALGLGSTLLVNFVEPMAAGSGIPEVKAYLNGTNIFKYMQSITGLVKIFGVVCSVSAGLIIGKEGPLIHVGSIIAANLATLPGLTRAFGGRFFTFAKAYRYDRFKRDFVSAGAAAGVAAAFGSPTGGIMFSLEEASSFWSLSLTWKSYLATMLSTSTIWGLIAWKEHENSNRDLITFGRPSDTTQFQLYELFVFLFIGVMGGLMGAAFCEINFQISKWRREHLQGRAWRRVAEVLLCVFLTVTTFYWLPVIFRRCSKRVGNYRCTDAQNKYVDPSGQYECINYVFYEGTGCADDEYNELGTLMFQSTKKIIKALFHTPAGLDGEPGFSIGLLLIYTAATFALAVVTYGIGVPSGLFVPGILVGSGFGRVVGELMHGWDPKVNPGVYALIGAAGMLSGVCRITITLTVILFETTDELDLILPIMATVLVAKWVADCFNISLYDMHVELKAIPFVESHPPRRMEGISAKMVMSSPVRTLFEVDTVANAIGLLRNTRHNGFVVVSRKSGMCRGMILRNQLLVLIQKRRFGGTVASPAKHALLSLADFAPSLQSRIIKVETVKHIVDNLDADTAIDLRPYMNPASITVSESCPISRCYMLFRGMGIRHLPVVSDNSGRVVGIISRKLLMTDFQQDLY